MTGVWKSVNICAILHETTLYAQKEVKAKFIEIDNRLILCRSSLVIGLFVKNKGKNMSCPPCGNGDDRKGQLPGKLVGRKVINRETINIFGRKC